MHEGAIGAAAAIGVAALLMSARGGSSTPTVKPSSRPQAHRQRRPRPFVTLAPTW